jgi:polyketide synthase 2/polyketide synthase 5
MDEAGIAIVGAGCRFPGDVDSPGALWRLLAEGRDTVTAPPPGRWEPSAFDDPVLAAAGRTVPPYGAYLRDIAGFDASFFGISGREADALDPQHRLLLEVAWEALEHAGTPPSTLSGGPTGVFVGLSYTDYMERLAGEPAELDASLMANGHCVAAGRISYLLGLHGPAIAVDTACSSALVALHLAAQSLRDGECDRALAGGSTVMLLPRVTKTFVRNGMLSPTGRCQAFDAAADGFVRGEGAGVVVLRRLSDALRDSDRILAVIRGSAVNQDGRTDGLAAPSGTAQAAAARDALARGSVDPGDVGFIEAHGTGTPVGDPVEFGALAEVYGQGRDRCAIGSVKTNIGHLEPASGMPGLIKAILCTQHQRIPPNLHFTRWNPAIDASGTRFFIPTEMTRWPVTGASRLAAVSSFGYTGTNAHVVLEQAPAAPRVPRPRTARSSSAAARRAEVFLVGAGSGAALPAAATRLADWLEGDGRAIPLPDVAYTLARRRDPGPGRLGVAPPPAASSSTRCGRTAPGAPSRTSSPAPYPPG